MVDDRESQLKPFSLGIVIEDKLIGSDQIKVYPVEELPFIDGKISEFKSQFNVSAPNAKGTTKSSSLEGDAIIIADWIPYGISNRITSPDVIKNETVMIYRFADTDRYYWTTLFREPTLRRLETVCYLFGDLPNGMEPLNKENSYWCEVSTHEKYIHVHTSNSDGEPYVYDLLFDTANGSVTLQDDIGNTLLLDSRAATFNLTNSEGSSLSLEGPNLKINIPNNVSFNASTLEITATTTINGETTINDILNLNKGINVKGDNGTGKTGTFEGSLEMAGDLTTEGNIAATGSIHGSNVH